MVGNEEIGSTQLIIRALVYLRLTMLRNLVLRFVRRVREPRYLLGLAIAVGYFWLVLFNRPSRPGRGLPFPTSNNEVLEQFLAGVVSLVVMAMWLVSSGKPSLGFTEAEVAFLFPAPLKRSQLIHYKLLSNMAVGLFGALFVTLLFTRGQGGLLPALKYFGGWWLLMSILGLHSTAAGFTLARLGEGKLTLVLRRVVVGLLILAFLLLTAYLVFNDGKDNLGLLLAPGHWLLRPFFTSGLQYLAAMAALLVIWALHYVWVLKLETPFEENSVAMAARRATMVAQLRAGKGMRFGGKAKARNEPFALQAWMPVELVLLWKNLMLAPPYLNRRVFFAFVAIIVFGMRWLHAQDSVDTQRIAGLLGMVALMVLAYSLLLGPQLARIDLRSDLAQADLLKAWPVPGWRIVLGNLLAPTILMTGIGWLMILTAATGISSGGKMTPWLTVALKVSLALSTAVFLPALSALMLIGPNAAALFFPAWSQTGVANQRGFDVMGLRILLSLGQLLLLVICLLPAVLLGGVIFYFSQWFLPQEYGVVLMAGASLFVLVLEILFAIHLLGERLEKLDIAAELRQ